MNVDVSSMLRLTSPAAKAVQAVYLLAQFVYVAYSIAAVHSVAAVVAALALTVVGSVLLTRPLPDPFPLPHTAALLALVALINLLVLSSLPHSGWPAYAMWNLGATTWLLVFLAIRGRVGAAWLGFAIMTAVAVLWTTIGGNGAVPGLELVSRHLATLVVGTLFAVLLRRVASRITGLHERLLVETAADAAAQGELRERGRQAQQLELLARPALVRIAAGDVDDASDRIRYLLIEGALRDTLRAANLATPEVREVVLAARRRGVDVVLLDDSDSTLSPHQVSRVTGELIDELSRIDSGRLTVRLLPSGRDTIATMVGDLVGGRRRSRVPAVEDEPR